MRNRALSDQMRSWEGGAALFFSAGMGDRVAAPAHSRPTRGLSRQFERHPSPFLANGSWRQLSWAAPWCPARRALRARVKEMAPSSRLGPAWESVAVVCSGARRGEELTLAELRTSGSLAQSVAPESRESQADHESADHGEEPPAQGTGSGGDE